MEPKNDNIKKEVDYDLSNIVVGNCNGKYINLIDDMDKINYLAYRAEEVALVFMLEKLEVKTIKITNPNDRRENV